MHATLCSILSDAVEGGFLRHNPAWRTYRYAGRKTEKKIADAETVGKIISALEDESIKYETYFKLVIATGMRRGECCALQWGDIDWEQRSIHIRRNAVKVTDEEIFTKAPKTVSGDRYVYFSLEMESLLREYRQECAWETETYDGRELEAGDFLFRRKGCRLPMTPSTFTWRFKLILKKHSLPEYLNVHSLRHTNASLLIANGTDVATVAGLLGHSQPSTPWTSIPMPSIRTSRWPAECSRRGWRFETIQPAYTFNFLLRPLKNLQFSESESYLWCREPQQEHPL